MGSRPDQVPGPPMLLSLDALVDASGGDSSGSPMRAHASADATEPQGHSAAGLIDDLVECAAAHGLVLELVDPEPTPARRCRYYAIHLQPNLFDGAVDLVRTWGRIGPVHRPRHLCASLRDIRAARAAIRPVVARRLRRGYRSSAPR